MVEQLDEDRLSPLEVVDQQDERALRGESLDEAPDRPTDLLGRAGSSADPTTAATPFADRARRRPTRRRPSRSSRGRHPASRRADARRREDEVSDRPIGDALAVRQAARAQDRGPLGDPREGLGDEAALADARRADDRDETGCPSEHALARRRRRGRPARRFGRRTAWSSAGRSRRHQSGPAGERHDDNRLAVSARRARFGRCRAADQPAVSAAISTSPGAARAARRAAR